MLLNESYLIIINLLINLIDVLIILLPVLLAVAFMTIIERKELAAMQRRVGPQVVGYYGVLQPLNYWVVVKNETICKELNIINNLQEIILFINSPQRPYVLQISK